MRSWILCFVAVAAIAGAWLSPAITQNPAYHQFADQRTLAGIPHFWNVVSNVPFLLVGVIGVGRWRRAQWHQCRDCWPWLVVALSAFLIACGSAFYHAHPNNQTLFWDRLPMTLGFMGVFAAVISERISAQIGHWLLAPLLMGGIASIAYWQWTGDLRIYALVQFYPMLAIPLMLALFPARYTASHRIWQMVLWYLLAKGLEHFDAAIYQALHFQMAGHALKHVVAAVALWMPLRMLGERQFSEGRAAWSITIDSHGPIAGTRRKPSYS